MLQLFVAVTFVFSLASIIAIHFNSSWISIQPKYSAKRPRGFYYETNEGGLNAFASTYLGLYFFWKNRDHFGKRPVPSDLLYVLNVPVQVLMIKANGSRTSLLLLLVTAVVLILITLKKRTEKDLPK